MIHHFYLLLFYSVMGAPLCLPLLLLLPGVFSVVVCFMSKQWGLFPSKVKNDPGMQLLHLSLKHFEYAFTFEEQNRLPVKQMKCKEWNFSGPVWECFAPQCPGRTCCWGAGKVSCRVHMVPAAVRFLSEWYLWYQPLTHFSLILMGKSLLLLLCYITADSSKIVLPGKPWAFSPQGPGPWQVFLGIFKVPFIHDSFLLTSSTTLACTQTFCCSYGTPYIFGFEPSLTFRFHQDGSALL